MVRKTCPENKMFSIYKFTVLLGICCVVHSFCIFCYFLRSEKLAGKAIMWKLGAEVVGLSIYCVFSTCEMLGEMPTPYISTWMRFVVFVSALAASIHMVNAIRKIARDDFE
jgi:succinate dehydrogenase hydrophobic anchor subunit